MLFVGFYHIASTSKDACKERVIMELINEKGNEELLQKVVSRDFCNLKVIYRLVIANDEDSVMSTIVTKSGMDYMHMSESELYDATLKNTKSFIPVQPPDFI